MRIANGDLHQFPFAISLFALLRRLGEFLAALDGLVDGAPTM
jgi:hypothetical protein